MEKEPLILGIDCSGGMTSLGLALGNKLLGETNLLLGRKQSELLPSLVSHMLSGWNFQLKDLHVLALTKDPGFFSGIRVGLAYGTSLAFSLGISTVSLSSLEVLAWGALPEEGALIMALMPAQRGAYFCGAYRVGEKALSVFAEEACLSAREVCSLAQEMCRQGSLYCVADLSCGEIPDFANLSVRFQRGYLRGTSLALLGGMKKVDKADSLSPRYLRTTW